MINWFNMPDEGLSNGGLFEVKELEATENGTYETKGEMYNKVTVNVEGGGGSSDFSTATITTSVSGGVGGVEAYQTFYLPYNTDAPYNAEMLFFADGYINTFEVPLYDGKTYVYNSGLYVYVNGTWTQSATAVFSGNVESTTIKGESAVIIKGDCTCTITIS